MKWGPWERGGEQRKIYTIKRSHSPLSPSVTIWLLSSARKQPGSQKWCKLRIMGLGRLRQMDCKFDASLVYVVRPCLQKQTSQPSNQDTQKKLTIK